MGEAARQSVMVATALCVKSSPVHRARQQSLRAGGAGRRLGAADGVGLQGPAAHVGEGRLEEDGLHGQLKRPQQQQGQRRIRGQHPAAHQQRSGPQTTRRYLIENTHLRV